MAKEDKTIEEMLDVVNGLSDDPDPCVCERLEEIRAELESIGDKLTALKLYQELGTNTDGAVSQAVTTAELLKKQDLLIGSGDGQNIKTINGTNILGSGNIEISGGGVTVYDGLDSTSATDALSANQGRVLNEKFGPALAKYRVYANSSSAAVASLNCNLTYNGEPFELKRHDIMLITFIETAGSFNNMLQTNVFNLSLLTSSVKFKIHTNDRHFIERPFTITNNNKRVSFTAGRELNEYNGTWANNNNYCIPYTIDVLRPIGV